MILQFQAFLLVTFYLFLFINAFFYTHFIQDLKDDQE